MSVPLTAAAAAKYAGVDPETVRRWCNNGGLEHGRLGAMYVIDPDALRAYLDRPRQTRPRKPGSKRISASTMITDRQVLPDDRVARNRAKIAEMEAAAAAGKLEPVYLDMAGHVVTAR